MFGSKHRRQRQKSAGSALTAVLSATLFGAAARANEPVRFEYSAPPECPNAEVFAERVRERSVHQRTAGMGELARNFAVKVRVDDGGAVASVDFVDSDGSEVSRSVRGDTCDEVVSGIALVTALAIDARAGSEPPPPAPPVSAPPPAPLPAPPPSPPPASKPVPPRRPPSFIAGLGAGYQSYAGPDGAPSLDVFFAAGLREAGPLARFSAFHLRSSVSDGEREGRLRIYGVRLEGCPLSLRFAPGFFEPCLGAGLGALFASGVESAALPDPDSKVQFWGDAVLIGRVGVVIGHRLVLEAQGELGVPFSGASFGFDGDSDNPVFSVPSAGGSARAGIGFRFP
ncbi:MAG TPA: hypothetical protein VGK73_22485 [Polyangiaceae bacterium]